MTRRTRTRFARRPLAMAWALAALALAPMAAPGLAAPAPATRAAARPLAWFLLRPGEQPGFAVRSRPITSGSLATFLVGASARERARRMKMLRAAGFREFSDEQLTAAEGAGGFSLVIELGSRRGAGQVAADLVRWGASGQTGRLTRFTVAGVPGASGLRAVAPRFSTASVVWADGRCALAAGAFRPRADARVAAPVTAGVRALYRRTRGRCPA